MCFNTSTRLCYKHEPFLLVEAFGDLLNHDSFFLLTAKCQRGGMTMFLIDLPHMFRAITVNHGIIRLPTCPVVPFINASEIRGHQRK